jgi:hypothetical protein
MPITFEPLWHRLIRRLLPAAVMDRPPVNETRNTKFLQQLPANDPTYLMVTDHLFVAFANHLQTALDPGRPDHDRVAACNAAAAVAGVLSELETKRAAWEEHRAGDERETPRP